MRDQGRKKQVERAKAAEAAGVCACFNVRKAARAVTQMYDERLRAVGLRATQFTLMMALRSVHTATVTELAERAVMDRTTLTRNLKLLEDQGLIRSRPGEDRRVRVVTLTAKGQSALAKAYPLWEETQQQMAEGLGEKRLSRLLSDLSASVAVARGS